MASKQRYIIADEHDGYKFEWELKLFPRTSKPAPKVTCPQCHGCDPRRGMFGSMDETLEACWRCRGAGEIDDPAFVWSPEPPKELVDALRKVWKDHWNKKMNDEFVLTPPPPGEIK